ncbi:MAG: hypothetical protein LBR85_01535 [Oscillospiraceae bacterium]|jgi:ribosomal protein L7Ae-like RNA K-turn-binding protein|nr:hypothetical protein [Oscillospiraceae bacterium]
MTGKFLTTLGLARKAGRVIYGLDSVRAGIGTCALILLASDAGASVCREARHLGEKHGVRVMTAQFPKTDIGRALGKSLCSIAGVTDTGFSKALISYGEAAEGVPH